MSKGRRTLEWSRGLRARLLPEEEERRDEELAEESDAAETWAVLAADVWLQLVRRGISLAAIAAVESRGFGGLMVLLRAAGFDGELERAGPPELACRVVLRESHWPFPA